jgi:hypothetical protein
MRMSWESLLKFIVICSLICMPLFMHSCLGGIAPEMIEGVEEAEEEEEIELLPVASFKLLRLDGTELDLDVRPIPCAVRIKISFDQGLDESEQAAVESGFVLREGETSLAVLFEWTDDQTLIITPASWFGYGKTYTVSLSTEVATFATQMAKAAEVIEFDFTTATWGDMNGDGAVDIIIGAPLADVTLDVPGGNERGRAYIFGIESGISDCNLSEGCSPDVTFVGAADEYNLGYSVATADVNADGYADVLLGSPGRWTFAWPSKRGWVYIFHGSADGIGGCDLSDPNTCTPDATLTGASERGQLGTSVSVAGDVNGDGYEDIIVGESLYDTDTVDDVGRAYVFLGSAGGIGDCDLSADPPCTPHATITGAGESEWLGTSVSYAGDVNGDGYDDIIVGAPVHDVGAEGSVGQAYLFHGSESGIPNCDLSADPPCTPHATITGVAGNDFLGGSVSGAGDVNGDGFDDIVVGAPYANGVFGDDGQAYVFHGSENGVIEEGSECRLSGDPPCPVEVTITGQGQWYDLGLSVRAAGDVNGDGYGDILVGEPNYSVVVAEGRAYIFYGSPDGITLESQSTITGADENGGVGVSLSGVGDLNGDGFDDVIVGAIEYGANNNGQAYIFHGSAGGIESCDLATPDFCEPHITFTGYEWDDLGVVR